MFGEILRRRDVRAVVWFHSDHWEPWGQGVNDVTLRRVDRFRQQAKSSPLANKATLFYLAGNDYRLAAPFRLGTGSHGEEIVEVAPRLERDERAAREALGELRSNTGVEFQLHLHHEHLVGNDGEWNDLHRTVKSLTDPRQDEKRLHYLVRTELATLRRHTGAAHDRWAFVHGMWALNGSDRSVCQIDNEIEILMQYGGWGDFTFPAARYHCDPTIVDRPYTCRPFTAAKAYDDPRCDPVAIDIGTGAIRDGRFLIWNSKAKHDVCSVDCFDSADRQRVKNTEGIVRSWLSGCPVIDSTLYVKTHAHSMHAAYYEDGAHMPLRSPDVEAAFDLLRRSCDEADAEFRPATVDEVFAVLSELDGRTGAIPEKPATSSLGLSATAGAPGTLSNLPSIDSVAVSILREWVRSDPANERSAGSYYLARLSRGHLFVDSELAIADYCRGRFDACTKFFELGFGFGELSLLLALSGFRATGYESDSGRYRGAKSIVEGVSQRGLDIGSLSLVHGVFPDCLALSSFGGEGLAVFVSTNVTSSHVMENIDVIQRSLRLFDSLIIDLSRFGTVRDEASQRELVADLGRAGFAEVSRIFAAGDTDIRHFERRIVDSDDARSKATPAETDEVLYSDLGNSVPRRLQTAPYYVFEGRDVAVDTVFPRLSKVPRTWLPPAPIRVGTFAVASSQPGATDVPPSLREGPVPGSGKFAFDRFGGHCVDTSYGVFKCLLLDPVASRDQRALEIFRFAAANIVHSCVDKATVLPRATRTSYVRPDLLLTKLFLSDQPLALHCDHATQVTAYLLHLSGYRVREILMTDPTVNSGHVVAEVFLPEQRRWVMLDPDFGVLVTDRAGRLLSTAELMTHTDRKRDLIVERVVDKRWASGSFDVGEAFSGHLGWSPASSLGSSTVIGDSYYQVMERCFRARTEITYRFNDGFEDNRLEKAADTGLDARAEATVTAPAAASFESGEGKDAVMRSQAFDPVKLFKSYFTLAGSVTLDACPVCESCRIAQLWRLPQSRLSGKTYLSAPGEPHNNTYLDYLPLLKVPQEIFGFDMCADCHSIFRNPKDDDQGAYKNDTSKVASFKQNGLDPFRDTAAVCEALFPPNTHFVVDAACGSGQVLAIYKEKYPNLRLFGLELSAPSVEWIKGLGIDAAVADLDLDDLEVHVAPGTVDFIVFNEAFEHVRSPLKVLRKMFRMLRPGGRIHFTAQYFGPENALQVRVGEPIYIDRYGLDWVIDQLDAELIELKADIKYRVTLEKRP